MNGKKIRKELFKSNMHGNFKCTLYRRKFVSKTMSLFISSPKIQGVAFVPNITIFPDINSFVISITFINLIWLDTDILKSDFYLFNHEISLSRYD